MVMGLNGNNPEVIRSDLRRKNAEIQSQIATARDENRPLCDWLSRAERTSVRQGPRQMLNVGLTSRRGRPGHGERLDCLLRATLNEPALPTRSSGTAVDSRMAGSTSYQPQTIVPSIDLNPQYIDQAEETMI